jgi:hypothetical protein
MEGKYFGERAGGVGSKTDVLIIRFGKPTFKIKETVLEKKLFPLCARLEPRVIRKTHIEVLNSLGGKLFDTVERLHMVKENGDWIIKPEGKPTAFRPSASSRSGVLP